MGLRGADDVDICYRALRPYIFRRVTNRILEGRFLGAGHCALRTLSLLLNPRLIHKCVAISGAADAYPVELPLDDR